MQQTKVVVASRLAIQVVSMCVCVWVDAELLHRKTIHLAQLFFLQKKKQTDLDAQSSNRWLW